MAEEVPTIAPHPESISQPAATVSEFAPAVFGMIADPWLRFFARLVDLQLWSILLALMLGLLWPSLFEEKSFLTSQLGSRLFGWVLVPFALILDALSYRFFGNTPGKWTAGIKVKSLAGDKVPFRTYLRRNFSLYWFGLGLQIPLVVLVTLWKNYGLAEEEMKQYAGTRASVRGHSSIRSAPRVLSLSGQFGSSCLFGKLLNRCSCRAPVTPITRLQNCIPRRFDEGTSSKE